jgi:hypothetical protein
VARRVLFPTGSDITASPQLNWIYISRQFLTVYACARKHMYSHLALFPQDPISQQARSSTGYYSRQFLTVHACARKYIYSHLALFPQDPISQPARSSTGYYSRQFLTVYACARKYMYSHLALFPQDPTSQSARSSTGYISADSSSLCMHVHANTYIAIWLCSHRIRHHSQLAAQLDIYQPFGFCSQIVCMLQRHWYCSQDRAGRSRHIFRPDSFT